MNHSIYTLNEALNGDAFLREVANFKMRLCEDQTAKSIKAAKNLVKEKLRYDDEQADKFIRTTFRDNLPALKTPNGGKFIFGAARIWCNGELRTANAIAKFNLILLVLSREPYYSKYDRDINGLSYQQLADEFDPIIEQSMENDKKDVSAMTFDTPSDYDIVRIDSYEQATQYEKYTTWCVTRDESAFDQATADGVNQFYFCLKKGYKNVPEQPGEGCPLDAYGLSMIAVNVSEDGMLVSCTSRWNHENGGEDHVMTPQEVSRVVGVNFYETFKPNNKFKEAVARAEEALRHGARPKEVFDRVGTFGNGFERVVLMNRFNLLTSENKLVFKEWFRREWRANYGCTLVQREDGTYNFINTDGQIVSKEWFAEAGCFYEGFASVRRKDGMWNFINTDGRIISKEGFRRESRFRNGFAGVQRKDGTYNFINTDGQIVSKEGFADVGDFYYGFARVQRVDGMWNFINTDGRIVSKEGFADEDHFYDDFAKVQRVDGEWYLLRKDGWLCDTKTRQPIEYVGTNNATSLDEALRRYLRTYLR